MLYPVQDDRMLRGHTALWRLEEPIPADLRQELVGRSPMVSHLLYCRGYRTAQDIESFLQGTLVSHDPASLPDIDAAVDRLIRAVRRGERVAVYGDFDCDGVTSAAFLVETLRRCGLTPIVHIPTRTEGHGLHPESLAALADRGVSLVVTADCGTAAVEEVQVARGMGMDVIITDHHLARADGSLPDCPTVNPTRHDSDYPCRFLCGVGVVYKFAQALNAALPIAPDPDDMLDLVAMGTIADVVPLQDENRSLVIRGIERLRRTERIGLRALFAAAGIEPAKIDPVSIGFYLAPRLNAANRLATPQLAYDLITATDPKVARALAQQLTDYNQQRQILVAESLERIRESLGDPTVLAGEVTRGERPPALIVMGDWQAGISGLLASKLVESYGLPAFVGSDGGDEVVPVSARGVPGMHIDEILEACEASLPGGLFLGYGGHSAAGGFRVARAQLGTAIRLLEEQTARLLEVEQVGTVLTIDAEVSLARLTLDAARHIRSLAPFGAGFPEPLFLVRGVRLKRRNVMGDGRHARFTLQGGNTLLDGIWFNVPPAFLQVPVGSSLDAVFHLQSNEWNGTSKPELRLRDWRASEGS